MAAVAKQAESVSVRQEPDAGTVRVTGRDLVVNGVAEVPRGLFSVHAVRLTPEMADEWGVEGIRLIHHKPTGVLTTSAAPFVLDCFYDRYQPALVLTRPDWESHLRDVARRHGDATRAAPGSRAVEFWNEPYLNWATKPGVNYDGIFYNLAQAAAGAPVFNRIGEPLTNLVWDAQRMVAIPRENDVPPQPDELKQLEQSGRVDYLATRFMPGNVQPGETFRWRDQPFVAARRWWVRDQSQSSWWSGRVNRDLYLRMAVAFGQEFKAADPHAPLVAGWGFHIFESNWGAWEQLHRPTIDALHAWIDGYGEHHYGVDPRRVAASYEIAGTYMLNRWGRRIGFWNTEAGGMQDPERPDSFSPLPAGDSLEESRGAAAYFLRDVLTMLRHVPDKARMRCAHEPQVNSGVPAALRLLKPLRGQLVETRCPEDGILAVASRIPGRLAVACYNEAPRPRTPVLDITPPAGTRLIAVTRRAIVGREGRLEVEERMEATPPERWTGTAELAPGTAELLVFELAGEVTPEVVRHEHHPGDAILQEVAAGKPASFRVPVPDPDRAGATACRVRWILAGADARLSFRVNGRDVAATGRRGPIREAAIPRDWLQGENTIEFRMDGWETTLVGCVSIVLEHTAPAGP